MRVRTLVVPDWVLGPTIGPAPIEIFTGEIGRWEGVICHAPEMLEIIAAMKRQHIPPNKNGYYVAFAHPDNVRALRG